VAARGPPGAWLAQGQGPQGRRSQPSVAEAHPSTPGRRIALACAPRPGLARAAPRRVAAPAGPLPGPRARSRTAPGSPPTPVGPPTRQEGAGMHRPPPGLGHADCGRGGLRAHTAVRAVVVVALLESLLHVRPHIRPVRSGLGPGPRRLRRPPAGGPDPSRHRADSRRPRDGALARLHGHGPGSRRCCARPASGARPPQAPAVRMIRRERRRRPPSPAGPGLCRSPCSPGAPPRR